MGKGKPKVSPVEPASSPPFEIDAAQIRKGSWELWEWMGEEIQIKFIDEILIKTLKTIFEDKNLVILHRGEVGL